MTMIRIPPHVSERELARALATLGLVIDGRPETLGDAWVHRCVPAAIALALPRQCAHPGCTSEAAVRLGRVDYCARHGAAEMEVAP